MPVPARRLLSGTIVVDPPEANEGRTVVYVPVSSHDQRMDLQAQAGRVTAWCVRNGLRVDEVVSEVGSGMNGRRPTRPGCCVTRRSPRSWSSTGTGWPGWGVEHLHAALTATGRRIVVVERSETTDDLVRDMIEVLTAMCARLYGRRGARNRALRAVTATTHDPAEAAQ